MKAHIERLTLSAVAAGEEFKFESVEVSEKDIGVLHDLNLVLVNHNMSHDHDDQVHYGDVIHVRGEKFLFACVVQIRNGYEERDGRFANLNEREYNHYRGLSADNRLKLAVVHLFGETVDVSNWRKKAAA